MRTQNCSILKRYIRVDTSLPFVFIYDVLSVSVSLRDFNNIQIHRIAFLKNLLYIFAWLSVEQAVGKF